MDFLCRGGFVRLETLNIMLVKNAAVLAILDFRCHKFRKCGFGFAVKAAAFTWRRFPAFSRPSGRQIQRSVITPFCFARTFRYRSCACPPASHGAPRLYLSRCPLFSCGVAVLHHLAFMSILVCYPSGEPGGYVQKKQKAAT